MPSVFCSNLDRWRRGNPGYEVRLWSESSVDLAQLECAAWSPDVRKPSMISDLVRLHKLFEFGGWWLDTDIELFRPLDTLANQGNRMLLGYMYDCALGTAMFYAPPRHPYVAGLLGRYRLLRPDRIPVNNSVFTEYFINEVPGFLLNGSEWENSDCHVFGKEMFEQPSLPWKNGIAMHHCAGAWMGKKAGTNFLYNRPCPNLSRVVKWAKRHVRTWLACRRNEFRSIYDAALFGRTMRFDPDIYYKSGDIAPLRKSQL